MPFALDGKRIWVAGHRGMVGAALVRRLRAEPCEVLTAGSNALDLRDGAAVAGWIADRRPDACFLAAAKVGGILANDRYPADFIHDNLMIEANVIGAAARAGMEKLVFLGSSCIYPRLAPQPIKEEYLLTGPLEPTNQWYAIAKIAGIKLCQAYRRQHGADFISAMPTNLYGPGDNYDLEGGHVVAALIRKAHEAKANGARELVIWGSGTPLREFLFVDDLADALVHLLRVYSDERPINVGFGSDIAIRELAEAVAAAVGFEGALRFDRDKPDGTPRKLMDSSRLAALGWRPATPLADGLKAAYADFLAGGGRGHQASAPELLAQSASNSAR